MNLNYRIPYEVTEYFDFIRSHPEEHNEWYFLFIELVEYIFEHEELYYDRYQIDKYFSYQKYFPFNLFPWEKCLLSAIAEWAQEMPLAISPGAKWFVCWWGNAPAW